MEILIHHTKELGCCAVKKELSVCQYHAKKCHMLFKLFPCNNF